RPASHARCARRRALGGQPPPVRGRPAAPRGGRPRPRLLIGVMAAFTLSLHEHRLAPSARLALVAAPRVLYVRDGDVDVSGTAVAAGAARHGALACAVTAGAQGATVLRYEVRGGDSAASDAPLLE